MTELIYSVDFSILDFIRENLDCAFLDVFLGIFTYMGNYGIIWIVLTLAALFSRKHRFTGIMMAAALVICLLSGNLLIKPLVARDRPFIANPEVALEIAPPSGYSFPSGHTFSSFVTATVIFLRSRKAGIFAVITAALIGFSRLYFYVHFPTDVFCGMLLGIITGTAVYLALKNKETSAEKLWEKSQK